MKKLISILLSVLMIFSSFAICVSAEENDPLVITVANDLHYNYNKSAAQFKGSYTDDLQHASGTGQLPLEGELIIDEFLKRAGENESSVVIIPGDITDRGLMIEHEIMAAKFAQFEQKTGKEVYIIPGNHDYLVNSNVKATPDDIKRIYAACGFDKAIAQDTQTASYVVDLNDEYRLIAIDAAYNTEAVHQQGFNKALYEWIEQQAIKGQADGKKMIAMSHFNLLEHMFMVEVIHPGSVMDKTFNLPELFAKYNIKYSFVGHTHEQDIVSYKGSNGITIYDVVTTSLNAYPCSYRVVTFGEKVKFEARYIDSVDTSALKGKIPDESYQLATDDFAKYAYNMFNIGTENTVMSYISSAKVKSLLGLDDEKDAELCALLDDIMPRMKEAMQMPLYTKDETVKGCSVESILKKYDLTISESNYTSVIEFAVNVYLAHVVGDESYGLLSKEFSMITACFNAIFIYTLENVSAEQYAQVMSILCNFLGANVPVDFFKYAGSGLKKAEGIEIFVTAVISPVLLEFTVDEGTPDNNVTLDGYNAVADAEPDELDLFGKIIKLFKDFFAYLIRILSFRIDF